MQILLAATLTSPNFYFCIIHFNTVSSTQGRRRDIFGGGGALVERPDM